MLTIEKIRNNVHVSPSRFVATENYVSSISEKNNYLFISVYNCGPLIRVNK